jgi:hypothetical protein
MCTILFVDTVFNYLAQQAYLEGAGHLEPVIIYFPCVIAYETHREKIK